MKEYKVADTQGGARQAQRPVGILDCLTKAVATTTGGSLLPLAVAPPGQQTKPGEARDTAPRTRRDAGARGVLFRCAMIRAPFAVDARSSSGDPVTEESLPSVDDPVGSPDRSKAAQEAAWAQVRARYTEARRPPLSAAERKEREGFSTLPMTDEMRTTLREIPLFAQNRFYGIYFSAVVILFMSEILVPLWVRKRYTVNLSQLCISLVIMAVVGVILVRWQRRRHIAQVNRLQTYSRYAGPCEIKETVTYNKQTTYRYDMSLASPPAPSADAMQLRLDNLFPHTGLVEVHWCTMEFVGKTIVSIRDDRDHVLFQYPDQYPGGM